MVFYEGQAVEVWGANMYPWREAKIEADILGQGLVYQVIFIDGTRNTFPANHIREKAQCLRKKTNGTLKLERLRLIGSVPMTRS